MRIHVLVAVTFGVIVCTSNAVSESKKELITAGQETSYSKDWHLRPWNVDETQAPVQASKIYAASIAVPFVLYPLFTRFLAISETGGKKTLVLASLSELEELRQNYGKIIDGSPETEHNRVPARVDMSTDDVGVNESTVETHDKQIITNHSYDEQTNNLAFIQYLPTITTTFLDSITHSIVGEIQQHVQLIKPGTKWCGDGNKARSYEDVGVLYKTDKCCRTHDKCPHYILSHEMKYGLHNEAHFTRSHCDCDASFYDCLKKVNSPFSTGVGIAYFNILKMKCFRLEYPVIMCSNFGGWFSKHCIEYLVDTSKPKQWQWFDNHEF